MDERKCRLVVSLHIVGDILHVRGFGDRVPAPFPPVHNSVVVYIGRGEDAHCTVLHVRWDEVERGSVEYAEHLCVPLSFCVVGRRSFCVLVPWSLFALVSALWAGDGVARDRAVPLKNKVERVLRVVWFTVEVGVPVQEVVALADDVLDGDRGVLVGHG